MFELISAGVATLAHLAVVTVWALTTPTFLWIFAGAAGLIVLGELLSLVAPGNNIWVPTAEGLAKIKAQREAYGLAPRDPVA